MRVKVVEVIEKPEFKQLSLFCKGRGEGLLEGRSFLSQYTLRYSTGDDSTIFFWDFLLFEYDEWSEIQKNCLKDIVKGQLCEKFEKHLKTTAENLENVQSIVIKKNRAVLWKIITDWELFKYHVPFIADSVKYTGEKSVLGTIISLKWEKKNIECLLKVIEFDQREEKSEWKFALSCFEAVPVNTTPMQELHFSLIKMNDQSTYVTFRHLFQQPLGYEYFKKLTEHKRNILKNLRKVLEHR